MTVVSWGVYGIFLHTGQMGMGDPANGRYKAFLFVGIAYFLTAVLAPLAMLLIRGRIKPEREQPIARAIISAYTPVLAWAVRKRRWVIGAALLIVLSTLPIVRSLGTV